MWKPRPHSNLWVSSSTLRRAQYSELVRNSEDSPYKGALVDIDKRRAAVAGLRLVMCALQLPIFAFFALSLVPAGANPSILVALSKELREILLVISAALGLCIGVAGYYHAALTDMLSAHLDARKENDSAREILRISFGIDAFPFPRATEGHFELESGYHFFVKIFNAIAVTTVVMLALTALFVRFKVLEDIYFTPTFSTPTSLWVIGFVVISDILGTMLFILDVGPIRTRRSGQDTSVQSSAGEKVH
jgi:hypothetical protein